MFHKKLLEILKILTPAEIKRFRLFLQSPYFVKGNLASQMIRLFDYIKKYDFDEFRPELSREQVFKCFFPDEPFIEKGKNSLDSIASELFKLVKQFLTHFEFEKMGYEEKELITLATFYREKGLNERFNQNRNSFKKLQSEKNAKDHHFFQYQFLMEFEEAQFQRLNTSFEDDSNLLSVHKSLDIYYLIQKLDLLCALEQQGRLSQLDLIDSKLIRTIRNELDENDYPESPLIELFLCLLKIVQINDSESDILHFEALLKKYSLVITEEYLNSFNAYLRFFWSRRYTKIGDTASQKKVFEIYKEHFEKSLFYINGQIQANALRTLLNFSLKLGHFDWIKQVMDSHPPEKISGTKYATELHSMNYAEYYFYLKQYDESIDRLIYRNFENPTYSILADVLLIKIYYETENDLVAFRVHSMRQKVSRSNLAPEIKERYNHFLNKMDKLVKYGWQKGNKKLLKVRDEVKSVSNIIEREWLLEKLNEVF